MADIIKLGRYDIVRVLGKGAMGVVYAGVDPNLERQVAIKTIRMQTLSPEAAVEFEGRFKTEARSAARLHHPNIVSVFDSGHDGDVTFLVMELIDGQDLKQHLESGARFSVRTAAVMVHDLLLALEHAHQQKVVHRDVKPANILIESNGRVKLTDFGVAKIQDADDSGLTQVGGSVGTPRYMAPEQAKGLRGDARSDLFSAAVVLHELLTGEAPFRGDNAFVIIHQIVSHVPPAPSSLNPQVPQALDAVVQKGLAKDPQERFHTAREFALALRAVIKTLPVSTSEGAQQGTLAASEARAQGEAESFQDGSSTSIFGPGDELVSTSPSVSTEADTETLVQAPAHVVPESSSRVGTGTLIGWALGALFLGGLIWWFGVRQQPAVAPVAAPAVVAPAASSVVVAPVAVTKEEIIESATTPPKAQASGTKPVKSAQAAVPAPSTRTAAIPEATKPAPSDTSRKSAGAGPSAAGEVCADRSFLFRIACVNKQCNSDRYRNTQECLNFREMERQREENREGRR